MKLKVLALAAGVGLFAASGASAATCYGNCGTLAPNGVVTAPPAGGPNYGYVSTSNGVNGKGQISDVGGTNGSEYISDAFSASAAETLSFYFNYVTSDGAGYSDYAFVELLTASNDHVAYLFTARTAPTGNTSPGFGLPANSATLNPVTSPITPGGPSWSALGGSSGGCYADGCGYTGWIQANYNVQDAGSYKVRFGVTNWVDTAYDSGLAYAGLKIGDTDIPVSPVPEPSTWAMMLIGFTGLGAVLRRRRALTAFA